MHPHILRPREASVTGNKRLALAAKLPVSGYHSIIFHFLGHMRQMTSQQMSSLIPKIALYRPHHAPPPPHPPPPDTYKPRKHLLSKQTLHPPSGRSNPSAIYTHTATPCDILSTSFLHLHPPPTPLPCLPQCSPGGHKRTQTDCTLRGPRTSLATSPPPPPRLTVCALNPREPAHQDGLLRGSAEAPLTFHAASTGKRSNVSSVPANWRAPFQP